MTDFWWYASLIFSVLCIIAGITGNGLTIAIFAKFPKFQNSIGIFILSLTFADGICLLVVPLYAIFFFNSGKWKLGLEICKVTKIISYGCYYTSAITIALVAINRCVKIVCTGYTYKRIFSKIGVTMILVGSWGVPFAMMILIGFDIGGKILVDEKEELCGVKPEESYFMFIAIIVFVLAAISVCYSIIYFTVRRSQQSVSSNVRRKSGSFQLFKMLFVTTVVFVVCFCPGPLIGSIYGKCDFQLTNSAITFFYYIPYYISLFLNPIIYGVLNTQFRKAYLEILAIIFRTSTAPSNIRMNSMSSRSTTQV